MTDESNSQEIHRLDRGIAAAFEAAGDTAPPLDMPNPDEQRGTRIGPYKLLQEIGEGGFGRVYMAEQLEPVRRKVALKIIKPGMDTRDVIARFESERQALAMMDHANIARVFDAGATETGQPYFVMELIKGVPITEFCDRNDFDTGKRLELFMTVCRAVQHAHQKGIIHRDLKPSNVMVTLSDGDPVPKVIDFGVSKAIRQCLTEKTLFTRYGQMIGTPQYMSPEQAEMSALDIDTRSDIYSLGVLLYELLTGAAPLEAERLRTAGYVEMLRMIQQDEPAKPSTRLSTLGDSLTVICGHRKTDAKRLRNLIRGDLDWITMKCLEKDRSRRYETANGLAADLQRHLNNEPVVARPPSAVYKLQKAWRRNKVIFAAGTAVLTALILGLTVAIWGFVHANGQHRLARAAEQYATGQQHKLERQIYLIHVGNVDEAIQDEDYHRAQLELELCNEELRGWEWSFLHRRLESIVPMQVSGNYMPSPVYSSDGKRLVVMGTPYTRDEGKAIVWDLASGRNDGEFEIGSSGWRKLALSGQLLGLVDTNGKLTVWNTETKRPIWSAEQIRSMSITSDNRLIAIGNDTLKVFDAPTGNLRSSVAIEKKMGDWTQVSPEGRWVAASEKGRLSLIEVSTGKIACQFPPNSEKLTFGPDGRVAVVDGNDIVIWNWDENKGEFEKTRSWRGPEYRGSKPKRLSFGAKGEHLVSTEGHGNVVTVFDVATGEEVATSVVVKGYLADMNPTEYQVAHPIHGDLIRVWNYKPQDENLTILPIAHGMARFSPDGQLIAVADNDRVSIRDVASGRILNTIEGRLVDCKAPGRRGAAPWMPDNQSIVVYSKSESRLEVWDFLKGEPIATSQAVYDKEATWLYVSNDGRQVTTVESGKSAEKSVRIWNIQTGKTSEFHTPRFWHHTVWENRLAFSGGGGNTQIWDTNRASKILDLPMFSRSLRFCGDGKRLFRGGYGGILALHDIDPNGLANSEPKQFTGHGGSYDLHYLVLSPDETQLLASDDAAKFPGQEDRAVLWDIESAQPLITFEGQVEDWSSDNKHIALSTAKGVHIWTLPPSP